MFGQLIINGLVSGGGYALSALGLALVFGVLDTINFAHGLFFTAGAFVAYSLTRQMGLAFIPSLAISMACISVVGVVIEWLIFRPLRDKGHLPQIIASTGLALIMVDAIRLIWTADPLHLPAPYISVVIHLGGVVLNLQRLLVLIVAITLVILLYLFIAHTWVGLQMRALAQDSVAAKLNGIKINRMSAITFAICAALTAAAGVLISPIFVLTPVVGNSVTIKSFAVVIFAGVGSIYGTIIAALLLGVIESLTAGYVAPGYESLIAFILIIFTLVLKPGGIMGKRET